MKKLYFFFAIFLFGLQMATTAYGDEGKICKELEIRLKAMKGMRAQNFITIRFSGASVWLKPAGPMGKKFDKYLQKIVRENEMQGGNFTGIVATVPTSAYMLPLMVDEQAFEEASRVDTETTDQLCGKNFFRKNGSSEKIVIYMDEKGIPHVREIDRDYLRQVEESDEIDMNNRHKGQEVTDHFFPDSPTIYRYRGEGLFNTGGDDVRIEMLKHKKTFFLNGKDALPIIGMLITGGDTGQRYPTLKPIYFYLKGK